ncbi:MAG: DNA translocase FtsK, partial [Deltaproteobacteria bacterium]
MLLLSLVVLVNFSLVITSKASFRFALHSLYFLQRKILLLWRTIKNRFIPIQRNVPKIGHPSAEQQKNAQAKPKISQEQFDFCRTDGSYIFPEINLLDNVEKKDENIKKEYLIANSQILERKLADFGVETKVTEVRPGPVVTTYELEPAAGVKINKITTLADDLSLALRAKSIRIIAPLPERGTIGIEIPNQHRESVYFKSMLESEAFQNSKSKISIALGADIVGMPVIVALEKMPHLLIAGTTGSGKSVALNAMICSILFKASPDEVKFLMIDPKRLELSSYEGIPHLLYPVVTDAKEASIILRWAVAEMERRYRVISETSVRNITDYNRLIDKTVASSPKGAVSIQKDTELANGVSSSLSKEDKLPYIVLVIDELADLMMVAQKDVETSLTRLAQMARAAGIHIILATQRPSVDVITGLIKANFPTRISFHVSSRIDSRTILDQLGAESLLGAGDMLFMPSGSSELTRIHGAF